MYILHTRSFAASMSGNNSFGQRAKENLNKVNEKRAKESGTEDGKKNTHTKYEWQTLHRHSLYSSHIYHTFLLQVQSVSIVAYCFQNTFLSGFLFRPNSIDQYTMADIVQVLRRLQPHSVAHTYTPNGAALEKG